MEDVVSRAHGSQTDHGVVTKKAPTQVAGTVMFYYVIPVKGNLIWLAWIGVRIPTFE
jgi:hypothetical protein